MFFELTKDPLFGMFLTMAAFIFFRMLSVRFKSFILNPTIFSIIFIIVFLNLLEIPYENYYKGSEIFNRMIVPATVALAVPLYKNFHVLKKYYKEILLGIGISTLLLLIILGLIMIILNMEEKIIASVLPKSITTAIAIGVSEKINGLPSITVVAVIICGNIGAIFGELIFKWFKIEHPIAQGISLGTTSHAIGTSKAVELGEIQGSMSGLAIIITGIFTVLLAPLVYALLILLKI
ncbi:LrgB family protein [Streptobacillus ratti]|uniref:LrgB family protein n=1 Tax=Streptobacillus ratti TaxID=1720557 RepID=UPI000934374B|nr:LrgB family protein [Streptobacillus ratti]